MISNTTDSAVIGSMDAGESELSIGARLRQRRKALRMTLKDVSEASGVAESFISQLERGIHTGSIRTLQKISAALGLVVGDLFSTEEAGGPRVIRFNPGDGFSFGENASKMRLTPRSFNHLEVFLGEFEPYGSTGVEPYSHGASEEVLVVLEGEVEVTLGGQTFALAALDSIPYLSRVAHRVAETAGRHAKVLWAMAPPSF